MTMPEFEYFEPTSIAEACDLLARDPAGSAVFAGGTDVLVYLKAGLEQHRTLVSLRKISDLDAVRRTDSGGLSIGAMTTINTVARSALVEDLFPGIVDAARSVAAEQVRNTATVAGNLCMAVPSADMAPILLALGASITVASPRARRSIPLSELFVGPRKTTLEATDIVTSIELPKPKAGTGDASLRHGGRVSLSLPIAAAAATVRLEHGICAHAAIALGAVAPTPLLVRKAGARLIGTKLKPEDIDDAARIAAEHARPITDLRASKEYRLELCEVLTRRVVRAAAKRAARED